MKQLIIGRRIKALRKKRKLSQKKLAEMLGFNNRQTVSAIETGARQVATAELMRLMDKFGESLEYFTDPFLLVGEGRFSWRKAHWVQTSAGQFEEYEKKAGRWMAAFRTLAPRVGHRESARLMRRALLGLTQDSSLEDARRAGGRFVEEFGIQDMPARRLADVMEKELGVLVLMADTQQGISGAACRLPELDSVLIARHEVPGRRHFNLAHELFHILTWDTMPPEYCEEEKDTGGRPRGNHVERLANSFAAAVLMPKSSLARFGDWSGHADDSVLIKKLNAAADELHVTALALKWRLVSLGILSQEKASNLPAAALRRNGQGNVKGVRPALFSRPFMEVIGLAIEQGLISVRRAAALLDLTIDGLADTFVAHGVANPIDL